MHRCVPPALLLLAFGILARPVSADPLQQPPAVVPQYPVALRPLTGPGATRPEWERRREELRRAWMDWLGPLPDSKPPLEARFEEKEVLSGFSRQRVTYQVEPGLRIDAMVLLPEPVRDRMPLILLFHPTYDGHYRRAVGLEGAGEPERQQALQWVEAGYAVVAPRCFLWEELPGGFQALPGENGWAAHARHMRERHPGWKAVTRMLWDGIRALDLAESIPGVDPGRIALFGHSLGAKEVLYVGAFDPRPRCVVFSEGGIGMWQSNWNAPWYLGPEIRDPGFPREHHELLALMAPRPFLLLAGGEGAADTDASWLFIEAARPVYGLFGMPEGVGWLAHGLGHRYGAGARVAAEAFVARWLGAVPGR